MCATASPSEGYVAVAPALFDRQLKDYQSGYTPPEIEKSRTFVAKPDWDAMLRDTDAAIKEIESVGPVAIVGFCMGGTIAYPRRDAAVRALSAAVAYYGGRDRQVRRREAEVPGADAFRREGPGIPMSDVEIIKQKRGGDCEIYVYHGRRPRLPLRRARQLPQGQRATWRTAHHRVPRQAHEEVRPRNHANRSPAMERQFRRGSLPVHAVRKI